MRITLVSGPSSGGAFRAMDRLKHGLSSLGQECVVFTNGKSPHVDSIEFQRLPLNPFINFSRRARYKLFSDELRRYKHQRFGSQSYFESPTALWGPDSYQDFPVCDIYHLHDLKQFIDYKTFFNKLFPDRPWVWTLHDMTPFTGGCDYDYGCNRYQEACGNCPALSSENANDPSSVNLAMKKKIFSLVDPDKVRIVAPSIWLAGEAKKSQIFKRFNVSVIPYGLNLDDFAPRCKIEAREVLGIPQGDFVILTIGTNLDDHRKGGQYLDQLLQNLQLNRSITLLSVGGGKVSLCDGRCKLRSVGMIHDDRLLSMVYSSADVFLLLSLADNLPNVVMESLACGTPVVAFDVGGIGDMVEHRQNGLLAPVGDVDQLQNHFEELAADPVVLHKMGQRARECAVAKFSSRAQAEQYLAIYQDITNM